MTVLRELVRRLDAADAYLLLARMTLFVALVNAHTELWLLVAVAVVVSALFFREDVLRSPLPWFGLAVLFASAQVPGWWVVDDHLVATTYWLVALGLSRVAREPVRTLSLASRLLVGLIFAFAFGWKLLSSQYTSGEFFEYTLVRDDRFEPVLVLAGDDETTLAENRHAVSRFTDTADVDDVLTLDTSGSSRLIARVFTGFGLVIEGAIMALFLAPLPPGARVIRPVAVAAFCLTTYAIVPVVGFGLLLMTMAAAGAMRPRLRSLCIVGAFAVFAWNSLLAAVVL